MKSATVSPNVTPPGARKPEIQDFDAFELEQWELHRKHFSKIEKATLFREFHDLHHGLYSKADWKAFIDGKRAELERIEI